MQTQPSWKNPTNLPTHDGNGWAIFNKTAVPHLDVEDVRKIVKRWLPPNSMLVGAPGAMRFLPPICIKEFKDQVLKNIAANSKKLTLAFIAAGSLIAGGGLAKNTTGILPLAAIFVLFGILFFVDYSIGLRTEENVFDRAMFFRWLKTSRRGRSGLLIWVVVAITIGVTQLVLQSVVGGIDALFDRYGVMYDSVRNGELWRLLSGPYFHYSVTHYSVNVLLLVFIGTLTWSMNGSMCILVFVGGNSVGAWMQMTFGGDVFNNFGGVSPGVYALFGLFLSSAASGSIALPKGFAFLCGGLAFLGIIGSSLVSKNTATVAHLSGLLFGTLLFLLVHLLSSFWRQRSSQA